MPARRRLEIVDVDQRDWWLRLFYTLCKTYVTTPHTLSSSPSRISIGANSGFAASTAVRHRDVIFFTVSSP